MVDDILISGDVGQVQWKLIKHREHKSSRSYQGFHLHFMDLRLKWSYKYPY